METSCRKTFWTFEQKERWLDSMSSNGYQLIYSRAFGRYYFELDQEKQNQYRVSPTFFPSEAAPQFLLNDGWSLLQDSTWYSPSKTFVKSTKTSETGESKFEKAKGHFDRLVSWFCLFVICYSIVLFSIILNLHNAIKYHYGTYLPFIVLILLCLVLLAWALTNLILAIKKMRISK